MENITLVFENGEYKVLLNGNKLSVSKDMELSIDNFKNAIKENAAKIEGTWENYLGRVDKSLVNINEEYQTMEIENLKFFYKTGKVFFMENGSMVQLTGGFSFFNGVIDMLKVGNIKNISDILELCKNILEGRAIYRVSENNISISSAAFNYGTCEYDFLKGRINKGASIEDGSFEDFKRYVYSIIRK